MPWPTDLLRYSTRSDHLTCCHPWEGHLGTAHYQGCAEIILVLMFLFLLLIKDLALL